MSPKILFTTLISATVALGIILFGSGAIKANIRPTIATETQPLPVSVTPFTLETGYETEIKFLGSVQASSDSLLGFEVAGRLDAVTVREGDYVSLGQPLGQLDTEQQQASLRLAQAQRSEVQAQLKLATLNRERIERLVNQGLASKADQDDANLTTEALQARLQTTEANVSNASIIIDKSTLVAPFDAVVAERLLEPGTVVSPNNAILRLVSVGSREVHVGIAPKFADTLVVGESYNVSIEGERVPAILRTVGDAIDTRTLSTLAVFTLPTDVSPRVGQTVTLVMTEQVYAQGGWLPLSALLEGDRGLWTVFTITARNKESAQLQRESVEVLHSSQAYAYVRGTLANEALVVSAGLQRLSPGMTVEPIPSIRVRD